MGETYMNTSSKEPREAGPNAVLGAYGDIPERKICHEQLCDDGRHEIHQDLSGTEICSPRASTGLVSIIILCHNQLDYTTQCVESIFKHTPEEIELIFVDNGSSDRTPEYLNSLSATHNNVHVITNKNNLGFAAAVNQGIRRATGDYVLLLNNDVLVTEGWLRRMLACANRDDRIGLVGPVSNYVAGIQRVVDPGYSVANLDEYAAEYSRKHAGSVQRTVRVIGFCMLIKRAVIDKIGGFDVTFGIGNFEDDDFCLRAGVAGFQVFIARDVFIHHYGSVTFKGANLDYAKLMRQNAWKFEKKWNIKLGNNGYNPLVVLRRPFDPVLHYFPLVSEWSAHALLSEAVRLFGLSKIVESYATLVRALELEPDNKDGWHNMALIAMSCGDFATALEWWRRFPEREMDAERLNLAGICCFQTGDLNGAVAYFQRVLEMEPTYPNARENLEIALKAANGLPPAAGVRVVH